MAKNTAIGGNRGEQRGRRHEVPRGLPHAAQRLQTGRDRPDRIRLDEHQRPEVVVPHEREDEHGHGGDRRAHERQHDEPEEPQLARTVYSRRVEQGVRQITDEVAHEQRAKTRLESDVEEDQRPSRVVQMQRNDEVADRDHQHLERHQIAGDEYGQQQPVSLEPVLGQRESGHRREQDRAGDRRDRDEEAVGEEAPGPRSAEHRRIIGPLQLVGPRPDTAAVELVDRMQRHQHDARERQQPDDEAGHHRDTVVDIEVQQSSPRRHRSHRATSVPGETCATAG